MLSKNQNLSLLGLALFIKQKASRLCAWSLQEKQRHASVKLILGFHQINVIADDSSDLYDNNTMIPLAPIFKKAYWSLAGLGAAYAVFLLCLLHPTAQKQ